MRILMYHEIVQGEPQDVHAVSAAAFKEQLKWLRDNDFRIIKMVDQINSDTSLPSISSRTVALTFDDGYLDNYTNAWPILSEFGYTATIFLVSDYMGKTSVWRAGALSYAPLLGWDQAREMSEAEITFGSHSSTHPDLSALARDDNKNELLRSKEQIEDYIGKIVLTFSYPFSQYNPGTKNLVKETGYKAACTYQPFYVGNAGRDPFELLRIGILANDTLEDFSAKVRGTFSRQLYWYRRLSSQWVRRMLH
jgi:peptidoglycan/xylan/chitin deacetylase (PgdA/CDA1 family)